MFWSELLHFFKARHTSGIILNIIPEYKSNFHHCTFLNLLALTCTVLHVFKIWWTGTICGLSNILGIHLILELTEFRSDKMQNGRNKNKTINIYCLIWEVYHSPLFSDFRSCTFSNWHFLHLCLVRWIHLFHLFNRGLGVFWQRQLPFLCKMEYNSLLESTANISIKEGFYDLLLSNIRKLEPKITIFFFSVGRFKKRVSLSHHLIIPRYKC